MSYFDSNTWGTPNFPTLDIDADALDDCIVWANVLKVGSYAHFDFGEEEMSNTASVLFSKRALGAVRIAHANALLGDANVPNAVAAVQFVRVDNVWCVCMLLLGHPNTLRSYTFAQVQAQFDSSACQFGASVEQSIALAIAALLDSATLER